MVIKKIIKAAAKKALKSKGRLKTKAQVKRMRTAAIKAKYDQIDAKTNKKGRVDAQGRGIVSYKSAAEHKRDIARASKSKKHLQTWKRFIKTKQGSDMIKNRKVLKLSEQREVGYSGQTRKQARKDIATTKTKKQKIGAIASMYGYGSLRESEKREIGYSGFGGRYGYNYKENIKTLKAGRQLPKRPGTVKPKERKWSPYNKNVPGSVIRHDDEVAFWTKYDKGWRPKPRVLEPNIGSKIWNKYGQSIKSVAESKARAQRFLPNSSKKQNIAWLTGFGAATGSLPPLVGDLMDRQEKKKKKTIPKGQRDLKAEQKAYEDELRGEPGPYSAYPSP